MPETSRFAPLPSGWGFRLPPFTGMSASAVVAEGRAKRPPAEALVDLRRRLAVLPARDRLRKEAVAETAAFFGISVATLYRCLREQLRPKSVRRADHGRPRVASLTEMEHYAEIVAALKLRTTNKQGRKISTARDHVARGARRRNPARPRQSTERAARTGDDGPLYAPGRPRSSPHHPAARRGALSGAAIERAVAVRHVAFRPEAGEGAAVE